MFSKRFGLEPATLSSDKSGEVHDSEIGGGEVMSTSTASSAQSSRPATPLQVPFHAAVHHGVVVVDDAGRRLAGTKMGRVQTEIVPVEQES